MLACRWLPNSCSESVSAGIAQRLVAARHAPHAGHQPLGLGRQHARVEHHRGGRRDVGVEDRDRALGVEHLDRLRRDRSEQVEAEQDVDAAAAGPDLARDRRRRPGAGPRSRARPSGRARSDPARRRSGLQDGRRYAGSLRPSPRRYRQRRACESGRRREPARSAPAGPRAPPERAVRSRAASRARPAGTTGSRP